MQCPVVGSAHQAKTRYQAKYATGSQVSTGLVGSIVNFTLADSLLDQGGPDLALVGRGFRKKVSLVFEWADEIAHKMQMPNQIRWGFEGRRSGERRYRSIVENKA